MKKFIFIIALGITASVFFCGPGNKAESQNSSSGQIKQLIDQGAMIVDVRTPMEYGSGHYPAAVNIPLQDLPSRVGELGIDKNRTIIVYCASGARSSSARNWLMTQGFRRIFNGGGLSDMLG